MPCQGPACGFPILTLGPDSRPKRIPSRSPWLSSPGAILLRRCGAPRWPLPSSDLATQAHLKLDRSQDTTRNRFGSWESHLLAVALLKQKRCWRFAYPWRTLARIAFTRRATLGANSASGHCPSMASSSMYLSSSSGLASPLVTTIAWLLLTSPPWTPSHS